MPYPISRRAAIACCTGLLCASSILYLYANHSIALYHKLLNSYPDHSNITEPPRFLNVTPIWTTEQETVRFAYAQYVTDLDYLCNAIINFSQLRRFGTEMEMALVFPDSWEQAGSSKESSAVQAVRANYPHINLHPLPVVTTSKGDSTWHKSLTKFQSFHLTNYSRIMAFDSDAMVLNNMDHYFLAPHAPIAVPRAYWLGDAGAEIKDQILSSTVMLLEPSDAIYNLIMTEAQASQDFDMEVINTLFKDNAMILPHRRLALLTGEFRTNNHQKYLSEAPGDEWNAMAEVSRACLVHFSDWPLPKPWRTHSKQQWNDAIPKCDPVNVEKDREREDRPKCADQLMWTGFYEDYLMQKTQVCRILY